MHLGDFFSFESGCGGCGVVCVFSFFCNHALLPRAIVKCLSFLWGETNFYNYLS
jgi:hypothetical protein